MFLVVSFLCYLTSFIICCIIATEYLAHMLLILIQLSNRNSCCYYL